MRFARFSKYLTKDAGFKDWRSQIGLRSDGSQLVRLRGEDMSELRLQAMRRDDWSCVDCRPFTGHWSQLELSHDISRGRGGSDVLDNVHMRCRRHHRLLDNNQPKFGPQHDKAGKKEKAIA